MSATMTPDQRAARGAELYRIHSEKNLARYAEASHRARDIGKVPPPADYERRLRCESDFGAFCKTYFPETFYLEWSVDHLKAIEKIERVAKSGGLFALSMPRGSGKTTLCERAAIWAVLTGKRKFVDLIGSDLNKSKMNLQAIRVELETNELLGEDFPEVCYPIRRLERVSIRSKGQLCCGKSTYIEITADKIVLPMVPERALKDWYEEDMALGRSQGGIIMVAGLTGSLRGVKHVLPNGKTIRPDLVLLDDPQTRESAASVSQSATREKIVKADVLGLSGPGVKIAAIMPCTIIHKGDMADRILDPQRNPEWQGEKTKMLISFPTNMELWEEYNKARQEEFRRERGHVESNKFYLDRREEMDSGAKVSWEDRRYDDEVSAIQHAMNLYFRDPFAFASEYQNEPVDEFAGEDSFLDADQIIEKTHSLPRWGVPLSAGKITSFIDVQKRALYYCTIAWRDDFTGWIVDYGAWPDQKKHYFYNNAVRYSLQMQARAQDLSGQVYNGLNHLTTEIASRVFRREDGAEMHVDRILIDANWGESTEVVYQFCGDKQGSVKCWPSHGRYVGANGDPFNDYKKKPGDWVGDNWRVPAVRGRRAVRYVLYDTNYWKTHFHVGLATPAGSVGCISLFQQKFAEHHKMFADHLTAEYGTKVQGRRREIIEWKMRPNRSDNHWFDCVVGCCVAAAMEGVVRPKAAGPSSRNPNVATRVKLSDLRAKKRAR